MMNLAEYCRRCIIANAQSPDRDCSVVAGVTLGQGRHGHKRYIRVRREVRQMGPAYWRRVRADQEYAASLYLQSSSTDWEK
jgi:hypothetical protein